MEIIDAQIHQPAAWLVEPDEDEQEGFGAGGEEEWALATEIALAYMDAAGVDRAVISWDIGWCEFAARHVPDRFASTPEAPDAEAPDFDEQFVDLIGRPGVVGLRAALNWPDESAEKLKRGGLDPLFKACDEHSVPLMVMSGGEPELASLIAKEHPNLSLIIDHIGMKQPPVWQEADTPPFKKLPQLLELAQYDKVTVKFSGAPTLTAEPYPFRDLWPHLNQIVEAFGPERLMWGTDIQRVNGRVAHSTWDFDFVGRHSYGEAVGFLRDTDQLSQSDKEQIFAGTLRRVLGWPA